MERPYELEAESPPNYLLFSLGSETCAVPILSVRQVIKPTVLKPIPLLSNTSTTQTRLKGVINLRGKIIGVMDLRTQFGLSDHTPGPILILEAREAHRSDSEPIGLVVDDLITVRSFTKEEMRGTPSEQMASSRIPTKYLEGWTQFRDGPVQLICLEKVVYD